MKTNVAVTSIETYHAEIKGKKDIPQNQQVLNCLQRHGRSMTCREISKYTKIENSDVARCLNDLKKEGKVEVTIYAKCRLTDHKAQHYIIVEPGKQQSIF